MDLGVSVLSSLGGRHVDNLSDETESMANERKRRSREEGRGKKKRVSEKFTSGGRVKRCHVFARVPQSYRLPETSSDYLE